MALKDKELENHPEFQALKELGDIDQDSLLKQAGFETNDPPVDPPVVDPVDPPVVDPVDPPVVDPVVDPVDPKKITDPPPDQGSILLNEIFGDRYKTVEEAKAANIPNLIDEVVSLRETKTELEGKLNLKPKSNFATDEVALYNEFVRETGVNNYGVFQKIQNANIADMDPMEALVTKHIMDNPNLSGKEPQVRKYFEKKYGVDPDVVDEQELEVNKIGLSSDGEAAKKSLGEVKEKLKIPEPTLEPSGAVELTPEEKTTLQTGWNNVGKEIGTVLAKLNVPIKNSKDPLLAYDISEAERQSIADFVKNHAVENQMELNETNVKTVSTMVYNTLLVSKLPEIVHSVFEKARSMTKEQVESLYENPSPPRNKDQPPVDPDPVITDAEKTQDEIFNAEMDNYNT